MKGQHKDLSDCLKDVTFPKLPKIPDSLKYVSMATLKELFKRKALTKSEEKFLRRFFRDLWGRSGGERK